MGLLDFPDSPADDNVMHTFDTSVPATICGEFENLGVSDVTEQDRRVVFEEQGTIIAVHGFGCAKRNSGGIVKVEQSLEIPRYANKATVFLNGWRLNYLDSDHEVQALGTAVGKIGLADGKLTWNAVGMLRDKNGDDGHNWCYNYTVMAWNDAALNAVVDHDDADSFCKAGTGASDNFYFADNEGTTTALSSFSSFIQNPNFPPGGTVAVLPRGFGVGWGTDHHLLQAAYNLDHSETFVEHGRKYKKASGEIDAPLPTPASRADSGFVSWETYGIFKDNDGRRDYVFGEMVSALGGNDVRVLQPPFSIVPIEDHEDIFSTCVSSGSGVETQEFVIENVPFEYAIPMLTGWELGYRCDDEHVKEIGIWIDEWGYEKTPGALTGTLRYKLSSVLRDKDDDPGYNHRHKVTILGLRPVAGESLIHKAPDLVPFSPSGNSATAFCRIEQDRKLRVTVKNQGNDNATASKTTVIFGDIPLTLDTPPVPAGGTIDLLFKVPTNCFNPDCSFKITVDANNEVNESNNEGNNSAHGRCIG